MPRKSMNHKPSLWGCIEKYLKSKRKPRKLALFFYGAIKNKMKSKVVQG